MKIRHSQVIVTGGAGFIGSHLVDRLLNLENEVLVIDDFSSGSLINLASHRHEARLRIEKVDILDEPLMMRLHQGAQFVFHLATRNVRLSLLQPTTVHQVNTTGTLNVLKAAAAAGVKGFLYCSSSEVNGTAVQVPMAEDYHFRPETIYGASKLAGEYYTQVFQRSGWLPTVIARPHNNYGPREHYAGVLGEVIPRFIILALAGRPPIIYGDGKQTRDFTYVSETADFLVRLLESDRASGGTFNICRGEEISIAQIADLIINLVNPSLVPKFLPGRPSDVLRLCGDPTRLRQVLGSSPNISIQAGLAETVAWFRQHVPLTPEVLADLQPRNWHTVKPEPWIPTAGSDRATS
jgi:UDP-glucose 4-epimerase